VALIVFDLALPVAAPKPEPPREIPVEIVAAAPEPPEKAPPVPEATEPEEAEPELEPAEEEQTTEEEAEKPKEPLAEPAPEPPPPEKVAPEPMPKPEPPTQEAAKPPPDQPVYPGRFEGDWVLEPLKVDVGHRCGWATVTGAMRLEEKVGPGTWRGVLRTTIRWALCQPEGARYAITLRVDPDGTVTMTGSGGFVDRGVMEGDVMVLRDDYGRSVWRRR